MQCAGILGRNLFRRYRTGFSRFDPGKIPSHEVATSTPQSAPLIFAAHLQSLQKHLEQPQIATPNLISSPDNPPRIPFKRLFISRYAPSRSNGCMFHFLRLGSIASRAKRHRHALCQRYCRRFTTDDVANQNNQPKHKLINFSYSEEYFLKLSNGFSSSLSIAATIPPYQFSISNGRIIHSQDGIPRPYASAAKPDNRVLTQ